MAMSRSSYVVALLMLACVVSPRWLRVNFSASAPYGLYRLRAVQEPLARGALVVLPVPTPVRRFWSRWTPLLKPVAAVAGDEACVRPTEPWFRLEADDVGTLWVRASGEDPWRWYGPVFRQAHGQSLPRMADCLTVQEGDVFLASDTPRSLDSRYFSVVPIAALTAEARPLLTWTPSLLPWWCQEHGPSRGVVHTAKESCNDATQQQSAPK